MKTTINFYDFERSFSDADRKENFSYAGKRALFNFFEELEECSDQEIELDVIAICCEFSEMNLDEFLEYYDVDEDELDSRDSIQAYLEHNAGWFEFCHSEYPCDGFDHWTIVFSDF